jgi:hypothetical protein
VSLIAGALVCLFFMVTAVAGAQPVESHGQHVYVPAYSFLTVGPRDTQIRLTTVLSVRNVDPNRSMRLIAADYYDTDGARLDRYVRDPILIGPLGTHHIRIAEADLRGGEGANFIVEWAADPPVVPPLIETVMLGLASAQGISFTGEGRVIQERYPEE